jgi:hypothetical protein
MSLPTMTEDQRLMVVTMLANAIRKDAHLRERAAHMRQGESIITATHTVQRAEASRRYVDGMCDIVRVLFADGQSVVASCLEDAYALAMGVIPPRDGNGKPPV